MAFLNRQLGIAFAARLAVLCVLSVLTLPGTAQVALASNNEKELKVAFLYNFTLFTVWPAELGPTLNLCIHGDDPFGKAIDALQGKAVGGRSIAVRRTHVSESFKECQVVFFAGNISNRLPLMLDELRGRQVLTVADSPGAARQGVALNMLVAQNKVTFEVNLQSVRAVGLNLSSKLLRLATEVIQ